MSPQNNSMPIVEFNNVSKIYTTYSNPRHRLLELLSGGKKRYAKQTHALDNVSFSLQQGARLGIVGENGSGKSTLLKVLSGVLTPSSGMVKVTGRISALLELGAGFNPEMTGKENIRQFCMLHGLTQHEIEQALPEIVHFSELRSAIQDPVKTYSSGMAVRLGFACAVYVKPEILIVDEALSVGDSYFQNKCMHKIKSMLDDGITFIYVTHAADSVRSLCNQGLWMEHGRVRLAGLASEVGAAYQRSIFEKMTTSGLTEENRLQHQTDKAITTPTESKARYARFKERVDPLRTGSGEVVTCDIALIGSNGDTTDSLEFEESIKVRVYYQVLRPFQGELAVTLGITDSTGKQLVHFNSIEQQISIDSSSDSAVQMIEFAFVNPLCPGNYGLITGIGTFFLHPTLKGQWNVQHIVDYCAGGARFSVRYPHLGEGRNLWSLLHVPSIMTKNKVAL